MQCPMPSHLSLPANQLPTSNHCKQSISTASSKKSEPIAEMPPRSTNREWILTMDPHQNIIIKPTFALPIRLPIMAHLATVNSFKASSSPWFHLRAVVNGKNNKEKAYMPTRGIAKWLYKHNNNSTKGIFYSSKLTISNSVRWKPRRRNWEGWRLRTSAVKRNWKMFHKKCWNQRRQG